MRGKALETAESPFAKAYEISDQSKALSLEFANSAFGLKQCKFALRDAPCAKTGYPEIL